MHVSTADFLTGLRIMEGMGLTEGFGHLSEKQEDGSFVMTPAKGPGMAAEEDLVIIDSRGEPLEADPMSCAIERYMHAGIYEKHGSIGAVCRTHSRACVSWGATGRPLPVCHGFGWMLGDDVQCHQEVDLIHNLDMGRALAASLPEGSNGLLIRGNGALAIGQTLQDAVVHAIYLEEAARIALDLGGQTPSAPEGPVLSSRRQWHARERARAWAYYAWKYAG
jgi:HCOMODA/2-hydroxy-3-carboxy-muconic semialdehyde decarboxylase